MARKQQQRRPAVFISYSQDSQEHKTRVLDLSRRLRKDGVGCVLDQYEESPPEGWPRWTERHIHNADFVLLVCTETYYKRVMGEEKPGVGQGVRWEGNLIYQHIYNADTKNTRFVPVLFADGQISHIPTPLQGATYYPVDAKDGYESLLRRLTNQPRVRKPSLGELKILPPVEPREREQGLAPTVQSSWPAVSLPRGGPKVSVPFAGREEELKELTAGMGSGKKVVAVVGMAGQGKSCLIGEWYQRGARPPQGIGLFWRKVYEPGYTFDCFIDDLHLYLTGEPIDRQQIKTLRDRATVVESLLVAKPCWIVLDGVERWLKRWVSDPDAEEKDPTPDDRAGHDPVLDGFFKGASFWENGSRLVLTTRAIPSALDEDPPATIGHRQGHEKLLKDLKPEEAIGLLDELDVKGPEEAKREAVTAYGCHAFAVHVLGALLRDWYGGDASRWREVNPLRDHKLAGLFERIIDTCQADLPLLEFVACSLGPAPVEMLAELTAQEETSVRKSLAGLKKWQMVEFDGSEVQQHTIIKRFMTARMRADNRKAYHRQIATWWWGKPETTTKLAVIDEIRLYLRAAEHLVAAGDVRWASHLLCARPPRDMHYTLDEWLRAFGYLDEEIRVDTVMIEGCAGLIGKEERRELRSHLVMFYNRRGLALQAQGDLARAINDFGQAIEITQELIQQEKRLELRNNLAACYANRGATLWAQGHLSEAIADHDQAVRIYERLIEKEGQRELRSDLAKCYDNRGTALRVQDHLAEAIADHARAVEITEQLVEREGRLELRNNLASHYNNRGLALYVQGHLPEAIADFNRAIGIREGLVERENRRELRNDLAGCYNNRGAAWRIRGDIVEAIADFGRATEIVESLVRQEGRREVRDTLASHYNNRGLALADQGRLEEAVADYDRSIEIRKGLVEQEGRRELRNNLAMCYNHRGAALYAQGRLDEAITDHGRAIEAIKELVEREGRCELRNELAMCYNNRGNALRGQGHEPEAIADYDQAIEIYEGLVEQEGQQELRNDLARCCSNRAVALQAQNNLSGATADHDRAIHIREGLVEREGRHELRSDLARSLFVRAIARGQDGEWQGADADIEKGTALLQAVVREGQRQFLGSLLQTLGFRCQCAKELGDPAKAVSEANEAMRWFFEEVEQNCATEPLLKMAAMFAVGVRGNQELLLQHSLDEALWQRFQVSLGPAAPPNPS
jgi:tetratricopeptide (TPR) repeat protein